MIISCVIAACGALIIGILAGWIICDIKRDDAEKSRERDSHKILTFYMLFNHWLKRKLAGNDLTVFFHDKGIKTVAIYGMKELGERLYDELDHSDINVRCVIDRNKSGIYVPVEVLTPDDELPEVDAVIVTAVTYYDEIKTDMEKKIDCPIISLLDIVYYES